MAASIPPTDQRAQVRPIAFVLDDDGALSDPVLLKIRPEDLSRAEPSRITVHQTLGREIAGWVDNFGMGLPSCTISGHTGWRATGYSQEDGFQAFQSLNQLVMRDYHAAKQAAIEDGRDPAGVKLLFIDMLDDFAWSVAPMQFVLRRSKSRPLLIQYNISLQAVATSVDVQLIVVPDFGSVPAGLARLGGVLGDIASVAGTIRGAINDAVAFVDGGLSYVSDIVSEYTGIANMVLGEVYSVVKSVTGGASVLSNRAIGIAKDLAGVGTNVFRTFSAIQGLPASLQAEISKVASSFNEVGYIFNNALRPASMYSDFSGLFGASNGSSTAGGRPDSAYSGENPFELMLPDRGPFTFSTAAQAAIAALKAMDPVLSPMAIQELGRNLNEINKGILRA